MLGLTIAMWAGLLAAAQIEGQAIQSGCWPGTVRYEASFDANIVCNSNGHWISSPQGYDRLRRNLVGHWKMDEQTGNEVADDSGFGHHGTASGASPTLAKFTRGRQFNSAGRITIPQYAGISFGVHSFVVAGWAKIQDVSYPRTTFAVLKGFGCFFGPGTGLRWTPGWEIGHGYKALGTRVCIRDQQNNKVDVTLTHDNGFENAKLIGKWTHYACVFDRENKKIRLYINGKKQSREVDISSVTGSVDNNQPLTFGTLYGWQTIGTLDEYRLYNNVLDDVEIRRLYLDHRF